MNKCIKRMTAIVIGVLLLVSAVISVSADTYYEYYGYFYTYINNSSVSLADWDNRSPELIIPAELNHRAVVSIKNTAFYQNSTITSVDFSQASNLKRIGSNAFFGCKSINTEIILPDSLENIDNCAFQECENLPKVTVNIGLKVIPNQCFYQCSSLTEAVLPDTIETIQPWAFADCPSLEYVNIPQSVSSINVTSFSGDENLTLGVWYGSYGYDYAVAQNIPYVLLDNALLGDANGDGYVNVNDVTAIQRHAAELEPLEGICFHAADIDGDGDVSVDDATELQRYLAEYAVDYPVGEKLLQ